MSDTGRADGEISRVYEYQEAHPNLIRVEEKLYSTHFVAFAVLSGIALRGWKSLEGTTCRVDYRRGVKLSAGQLHNVVSPERLSYVATAEHGLRKLLLGRTDLFVDVDFTIRDAIKGLDPAKFDAEAFYQAGTMQAIDADAYLHKKHAALVPKIAAILKDMKRDGLFEQCFEIASKLP